MRTSFSEAPSSPDPEPGRIGEALSPIYAALMKAIWSPVPTFLGVLFLAIVIGGAGLWTAGWVPWPAAHVTGVDVSHHQGRIDWKKLAETDVRFAYIKATEGGDWVDPRFQENWREGHEAGLLRGAYHFFTLCRPGSVQADNFIRTAPRAPGMLPPAVDLEHLGPCTQGPTMIDPWPEISVYLDRLQSHYGVRPVLYATREFHDAFLRDVANERFWVRSLIVPPSWRTNEWVIWQHHNLARRPGVSGPVDLNAFRGDEAELAAFAGGR
jgi:lysozyme